MLEQKIDALTRAVEALTAAIIAAPIATPEVLQDADTVDAEKPHPSHEPAPTTVDDQTIKDLTLSMSRAGYRDDIRDKLSEFGVKKITDLKGDDAVAYYDWLLVLKGEA